MADLAGDLDKGPWPLPRSRQSRLNGRPATGGAADEAEDANATSPATSLSRHHDDGATSPPHFTTGADRPQKPPKGHNRPKGAGGCGALGLPHGFRRVFVLVIDV